MIGKGVNEDSINWPFINYMQEIMINKYIELHLPPLEKSRFQMTSLLRDYTLQADLEMRDLRLERFELFSRLIRLRGTLIVTGKLKRLKDLFRASGKTLKDKMKAADLETRWMAIQVIGTKRLPLQPELIARLSDRSYAVRQAARKALIRISRGNHFGPGPKATKAETEKAIRKWQNWWSLQDGNEERKLLAGSDRS
jgi:hypothetical protein